MFDLLSELNDHTPTQNLEVPKKNIEALGVAIYYFTYSTWEGPVLYVEDLFVTPNARGKLMSRWWSSPCDFCLKKQL